MKLLSSHFAAPVVLAVLSVVAGCSSDNSSGGNSAGSSAGGSASGGKPAATGGSVSAGGSTSAGGAGAGGSAAGSVSVGGSSAGSGTAGSAAAGSSAGGGAAVEASFATVKNMIMTSCFGGNGCHGQSENPMPLKLDDTLYATLTGHTTKNCGKLIDTTNAAGSALVKILQGDCGTPPNTTARMPFGTCMDGDTDPDSPCIQPPTIAAIQAWIAKGAPKQ